MLFEQDYFGEPIRVYYYDRQRLGNYQIRVGKKRDIERFRRYVDEKLRPLGKVSDYRKDMYRRYYVEWIHIDYMMNDDLIDLKDNSGYGWRKN